MDAIVYSPDSKWVATSAHDMSVILWDTSHGPMFQQSVPPTSNGGRKAPQIAFSPDSRHLAVCNGENISIWDINPGMHNVATIEGAVSGELLRWCAWSPNGALIASSSDEEGVRFWDAHTFSLCQDLIDDTTGCATEAHFSPDGRWLMSFNRKDRCWMQWDLASAQPYQVLRRYHSQYEYIAFDPESKRLAVQTYRDVITVFVAETGTPLTFIILGSDFKSFV